MLCEGTSLLEALHYKGVATNQDLMTFVKSMPLSPDNNPNNGFLVNGDTMWMELIKV